MLGGLRDFNNIFFIVKWLRNKNFEDLHFVLGRLNSHQHSSTLRVRNAVMILLRVKILTRKSSQLKPHHRQITTTQNVSRKFR